jgi:hypothetical protein
MRGVRLAEGKLTVLRENDCERGARMKVLVAGAHGKTARRLVRMLKEDGHEMRGLVRKEEQMPDVEADGAEPVLVGPSGGPWRVATP